MTSATSTQEEPERIKQGNRRKNAETRTETRTGRENGREHEAANIYCVHRRWQRKNDGF